MGDSQPGSSSACPDPPPRSAGRLLIVDDDYSLRRTLHLTLYNQGFDVNEAASADEATALARAIRYDAVVIDVNMPEKDGITLCRELRVSHPGFAILMLTVRSDPEDRISALDAGADDYIVKPFHMKELTARIRAAVRRVQTHREEYGDAIHIGVLSLYPSRRQLHKSGHPVHLTPKEFELLEYLMKHAGLPIAHAKLLSSVWGPEYISQVEYLRTFVRQLRRKIENDPARPEYLLTESYIGYRFTDGKPLTGGASNQVL